MANIVFHMKIRTSSSYFSIPGLRKQSDTLIDGQAGILPAKTVINFPA